ncbi:Ig-like domain-containing protein [Leptospira sp. 201903070]|uniref:Ig-like domain-containing protein n=1 Tax=Leptospira ainlahdjerensis TaxID=2810033 RepID=A0ABS2U947_9LEPT|nr:Ig-like domain-containing protein [Leptospira ainlahdjerensis]MBM9576888.1 Ig-like domain-containing protein [Leptospira ainlahdjerensis]
MQRSTKLILVLFLFVFQNCVKGSNSQNPLYAFLTFPGGDAVFGVSQITPGSGVTGIPLNTSVQVGFNQEIDPSSISNSSFRMTQGSTPVVGTITTTSTTAMFTPSNLLSSSTIYTVTLSKEILATDGSTLTEDYSWNFTTASTVDGIAPVVSLVAPANLFTNVGVNSNISAVFSEVINCATLTTASFTLTGGAAVAGTVNCSGTSATFDPTPTLAYNTNYTATLTTAVKDLAGNSIPATYSWSFTTGPAPDLTPPVVSLVTPTNLSTGAGINTNISAVFSEAMDCTTISTANFTLSDGAAVAGTVNCSGTSATFDPTAALAYNTNYTATITTTVKDVAGNPMAVNYSWSFTTSTGPEMIAPVVSLVAPANLLTNVGVNSNVTAVFSETMDCLTLNAVSFTLTGGAAVAGTVNCSGTSATFDPTPTLAYNTNYTATLTTAVKDLAGNSIPATYSWSFTTGPAPDLTPPVVSLVTPTNLSTGAGINTNISAVFSEAMDCTTISTANFTLSDGAAVAGTVNCSGTFATFDPTAALAYNTNYTATITTTVKDVAGNPMAVNYSWSFTTGNTPDITPPTVVLASPINGATGVATNANVIVAFSESMDCTTLNTITFSLSAGAAIPGTVTCSGASATFAPTAAFAPGTLVTATLTVGAMDLTGNPIAAPYSWTFTTGPAPDVTPPTVAIQNLRNNSIVESGFVIGTMTDAGGIASVAFKIDGGAFGAATLIGPNSWKFQLPITWSQNSQHTLTARATDISGNQTTTAVITVRKGTNKDINGDGYVDLVTSEYGQGLVYIFHSSGTLGITTTNAGLANRIIVGNAADEFGRTVSMGDLNGDSYADVVVGSPAWNGGMGRTFVFHSSGNLGVNTSFSAFASSRIDGATAGDRFGMSLATGDINGDGYTDLIVGSPNFNGSRGRVYVFLSTGVTGITVTNTAAAATNRTGASANELLGSSIGVGDINGDGLADLAVGSPGYSFPGPPAVIPSSGRIYIYYGGAGVLTGVTNTLTNQSGISTNAQFGLALAVADINGDGFSDVVGSAPLLDTDGTVGNGIGDGVGTVRAFMSAGGAGIANDTIGNAPLVINGVTMLDIFGVSVTARDLDGDGRADIAISATQQLLPSSAVYIFMTPTAGPIGNFFNKTNATASIAGSSGLGVSVGKGLSTGDTNGDGFPDLLIGGSAISVYGFHSSAAGLVTNNPAFAETRINDPGLLGGAPVNTYGNCVY